MHNPGAPEITGRALRDLDKFIRDLEYQLRGAYSLRAELEQRVHAAQIEAQRVAAVDAPTTTARLPAPLLRAI